MKRFIRKLLEKKPQDRFSSAEMALKALHTHRGLFSRRTVKRVVGGTLVAFLIVGVAVTGLIAWRRSESPVQFAVRTAYDKNVLRGLGEEGQTIWSVPTLAPIQQVTQADLFGDGRKEIVVATYDDSELIHQSRSASAHTSPQVLIVSMAGHILSDFRPEQEVHLPGDLIAPLLLWPSVKVLDLLGDGKRQILVNVHQRELGTDYMWIYWPRVDKWQLVLDHWGGWIFSEVAAVGGNPPRLRLLGFNGPLAAQPVEAELVVRPPWGKSSMMSVDMPLPGARVTDYSRFLWYTPISASTYNFRNPIEGFSVTADGSSRFVSKGRMVTIDRWGNPVPGPNAGKDLSLNRLEFLHRIYDLYEKAPDKDPQGIRRDINYIQETFARLLLEKPEREAFYQMCARAFARSGVPSDGIRLLQGALRRDGFNDSLTLNLGELLAIKGNLTEAKKVLTNGYLNQQTPAGGWLSTKVLGRIAIEGRNRTLLEKEELVLSNMGFSSSVGQVLAARARLWWNESIQADTQLGSYDLAPEGEAIACLARWRLHEIRTADAAAMTDSLKRNPDAAGECLIARAMAELNLHHPNRAVTDCLEAERRLSERSTCEFWAYQTMQLAHACHATALLAAGRRSEAKALANRILPRLHPGLLPYILTRQVLEASTSPKS
jgi:hypothetical protein